jgi:hypothetical protein
VLGCAGIVDKLISLGVDVNATWRNGDTALFMACRSRNLQIVTSLLAADAKVDACNGEKRTPLMMACEKCHFEIVSKLLKAGAEVNARDIHGRSPLFYASLKGAHTIVAELLKLGGDAWAQDNDGNLPVAMAEDDVIVCIGDETPESVMERYQKCMDMLEDAMREKIKESGKDPFTYHSVCCACLDRPSTHGFYPCGHVCLCDRDAEAFRRRGEHEDKTCPMCRGKAYMMRVSSDE